MRWPELLFILFVVVLGVSVAVFGWGVLVLVLVAWLLGGMLVAAVKYETWRTQSMQLTGTWKNLELHTGEMDQAAMVMLRIKDYTQVRLTVEEVKQLRDRLDSALQFSATENSQD